MYIIVTNINKFVKLILKFISDLTRSFILIKVIIPKNVTAPIEAP